MVNLSGNTFPFLQLGISYVAGVLSLKTHLSFCLEYNRMKMPYSLWKRQQKRIELFPSRTFFISIIYEAMDQPCGKGRPKRYLKTTIH